REQRGARRFEPCAPSSRRGERSLAVRPRTQAVENARRSPRVAEPSERHARLERERIAPEPAESAPREGRAGRSERELADEEDRLLLVFERRSGMRSRGERDQDRLAAPVPEVPEAERCRRPNARVRIVERRTR